MPAVSGTASSVKSAQQILANDNQPRTVSRAPAYVPPQGARNHNAPLAPDDVEDLYSIGEKDGKLWLKFISVPKTVFVFAGVPAELIQGLRTSIDRDEFFQNQIKDRPEYPVEVITAAKK